MSGLPRNRLYVTNPKRKASVWDTDTTYFYQNDFLAIGSNAGMNLFQAGTTSTFSGNQPTGQAGGNEHAIGVYHQNTGLQTNGFLTISIIGFRQIGNGTTLRIRWRSCMVNLSDGTDTFSWRLGLGETATVNAHGEPDYGFYFRYTHSVNGGRFEAVNRDNGVETAVDTGVSPQAGVYQVFEVLITSGVSDVDPNQIQYKIDGVTVATISTNIFNTTNRATSVFSTIEKSAGTNSRSIAHDWMDILVTRSNPR